MADVRFAEEAEAEYIEALLWYQARSEHAAARFREAVAHAIRRIAESPQQFPCCDQEGCRFAIVSRYPYSLIYREVGTEAQVIAVAHGSRKPGYWTGRESR